MKEANDDEEWLKGTALAKWFKRLKELENRYLMLEKWAEDHQNLHNAIERGD